LRKVPCCVAVVLACACACAQNLYPDAGFEKTGVAGTAHSGERAGHLAIGEPNHWVEIGGPLSVEPFATYQATAWAKASVEAGAALALYVYQWDAYEWRFSTSVDVSHATDWTQVSITFCVPQNTVLFHPLAFMDAAHGEAWIDDLVIERVKSPEETLRELMAQAQPQGDAARLLVRHYIGEGDTAAALKLLEGDLDDPTRADVAYVIGQASKDQGTRAHMLTTMLASGATDLNDGAKRVAGIAEGMDAQDGLARLRGAMAARPDDVRLIRGTAKYVAWTRQNTQAHTVAERERLLAAVGTIADVVRSSGSPEAAELVKEADAMRKNLDRDRAALGHCTLRIDGVRVTPESYTIVTPEEPTPQESLAARELCGHIERITGKALPIVAGKPATDHSIRLGRAGMSRRELADLGDEGIRIVSRAGELTLGGSKRGVLYAVYTFLEDHLGCRWYTPDCATWPTEGSLSVGDLNVTYVPPLEYRATDYPKSRPPEFAVRNKLNGTQIEASEEWGGKISYRGFVHTFNALVPSEQHFDAHPEYFSEINGVRVRDYTQLCLTNPDVLRVAIQTVRQWIAESPEATIISVSQNDWQNYCTCPQCSAVAEEEGSQSGPLLRFVNAIAADIEKDYPHIIIDTLAYQYTRKPPTVTKPRPNVAIRLCSIECEFNRPLATSEYNKTFVDDIRGWNAICDRLHIWDYVINYRHCVQPFPNLRVLQPNIRFFAENGVTGVYEEANYFSHGGEFAELRTYLMAKLLWNPGWDVERGINEFCRAYYGAAADRVEEYIDLIHEAAVSDDSFHMPIYVDCYSPFQTDEALRRYEKLFDDAEKRVADDPVRLHRVQVARLPIIYTRIAQASQPVYELTDTALRPVGGSDIRPYVDRFTTIAQAEGLTAVSEGGRYEDWLKRVSTVAGEHAVVRLASGGMSAAVVPSLGGRILSLAVDGQEMMLITKEGEGIDPLVGGYEEFSQAEYRSPGWTEPFEVIEQSPNAVSLRASLPNGLTLERRYELDGAARAVEVGSRLVNASDRPVAACLRVHPAMYLEDARTASLVVGGTRTSLEAGAEKETELWLRDAAKPAGEWRIEDPARKVTITSRFDPAEVATCYLNWNGPVHRVNLELWSPSVQLEPGSSIRVDHAYEFSVGR